MKLKTQTGRAKIHNCTLSLKC